MVQKRGPIARTSFSKASCIFPMSDYTLDKLRPYINTEMIVAYAGYDNNSFKHLDLQKLPFSIVYVGNLKPRKGFHVLLSAIKKLNLLSKPKLKLRLVGNFPKPQLDLLMSKYNDLVSYETYSNISSYHLNELYNSSVVNVLPSVSSSFNYEGFGIIHSEAIAANCLTVGSADSGNASAIEEGNGFLLGNSLDPSIELSNILDYIFNLSFALQKPTGPLPKTWDNVVDTISSRF